MDYWEVLVAAKNPTDPEATEATEIINECVEIFDEDFLVAMILGIETNPKSPLVFSAFSLIKRYYAPKMHIDIPTEITVRLIPLLHERLQSENTAMRNIVCQIVSCIIIKCCTGEQLIEQVKDLYIFLIGCIVRNVSGTLLVQSALDVARELSACKLLPPTVSISVVKLLSSDDDGVLNHVLCFMSGGNALQQLVDNDVDVGGLLPRIYELFDRDELKIPIVHFITELCEYPDLIPSVIEPMLELTIDEFELYDGLLKETIEPEGEINFNLLEKIIMALAVFWENCIKGCNEEENTLIAQELVCSALSLVQCVITEDPMDDCIQWDPTTAVQSIIGSLSVEVPSVMMDYYETYIPENFEDEDPGVREAAMHCLLHMLSFHPEEFVADGYMDIVQPRLDDPSPRVKSFALLCLQTACSRFGGHIAQPYMDHLFECIQLNDLSTKVACDILLTLASDEKFTDTEAFCDKLTESLHSVQVPHMKHPLRCYLFSLVHNECVPRCVELLTVLLETFASDAQPAEFDEAIRAVAMTLYSLLCVCLSPKAPDISALRRRIIDVLMTFYETLNIEEALPAIAVTVAGAREMHNDVFPVIHECIHTEIEDNLEEESNMKCVVCALSSMALTVPDAEQALEEVYFIGSSTDSINVLTDCVDLFVEECFLPENLERLVTLTIKLVQMLGECVLDSFAVQSIRFVKSACIAIRLIIKYATPFADCAPVISELIEHLTTVMQYDPDFVKMSEDDLNEVVAVFQEKTKEQEG